MRFGMVWIQKAITGRKKFQIQINKIINRYFIHTNRNWYSMDIPDCSVVHWRRPENGYMAWANWSVQYKRLNFISSVRTLVQFNDAERFSAEFVEKWNNNIINKFVGNDYYRFQCGWGNSNNNKKKQCAQIVQIGVWRYTNRMKGKLYTNTRDGMKYEWHQINLQWIS